jgi:hypothetical protein
VYSTSYSSLSLFRLDLDTLVDRLVASPVPSIPKSLLIRSFHYLTTGYVTAYLARTCPRLSYSLSSNLCISLLSGLLRYTAHLFGSSSIKHPHGLFQRPRVLASKKSSSHSDLDGLQSRTGQYHSNIEKEEGGGLIDASWKNKPTGTDKERSDPLDTKSRNTHTQSSLLPWGISRSIVNKRLYKLDLNLISPLFIILFRSLRYLHALLLLTLFYICLVQMIWTST